MPGSAHPRSPPSRSRRSIGALLFDGRTACSKGVSSRLPTPWRLLRDARSLRTTAASFVAVTRCYGFPARFVGFQPGTHSMSSPRATSTVNDVRLYALLSGHIGPVDG